MNYFASSATSIFSSDTATKLIESLTSVISANAPIVIAPLLYLLQISNHLCDFARYGVGFDEITIARFKEFFSLCTIMLEIRHKNNFCIFW